MKPWQINRSVSVIQTGGILAYPTEAVFGLGCSPYCLNAVNKIFKLKRRNTEKGLILVGADISQFSEIVDANRVMNMSEVLATWPGPVTWILPTKPGVPAWLTGKNRGLAVRISAHPVVSILCEKAGIMVSTSANPAGMVPARDFHQVRKYFADQIDYIFPGYVGADRGPTEIRDAQTGKILRSVS